MFEQEINDFENIFKKNYPLLCKQVVRITRDLESAEDIVQEVFVNLWEKDRANIANIEAYLYRACIHKALNYISVNNRRSVLNQTAVYPRQPTHTRSLDEEMEFRELERQVSAIIDSLPPMCKKVFLLSRYEEMSHKQIADFLAISPNTVDNHIKKALSVLRKVLLHLIIILHAFFTSL
jgi:RNA polymerase sigma-70 factor (ECF subfamily)